MNILLNKHSCSNRVFPFTSACYVLKWVLEKLALSNVNDVKNSGLEHFLGIDSPRIKQFKVTLFLKSKKKTK
jgi:hypothetical protein